MGSSKKHKEKDKEKDRDKAEKRDKSHKKKRSKDKNKDDLSEELPVPAGSPDLRKKLDEAEKQRKRKHKDKKSSSAEDSDAPPPSKSSKHAEKDSSGRSRAGNGSQHRQASPTKPHSRGGDDSIDGSSRSKPEMAKKALKRPHRQSPSPPPKSSGGGDSSLSIQETNKLRLKLGLKPLEISSGPSSSRPSPQQQQRAGGKDEDVGDDATAQRIKEEREQEGEVFWKEKLDFVHVPAGNISQQRNADKLRDKIQNQREKRRLETKLLTKGLADSDSDDDAGKWVEKTKRLAEQKALAEKRAKALAELDDEFGVGDLVDSEFQKAKTNSYNAKDLKGMKVMHDSDRIVEGESVIMTLDDKDVLDEKDDVLVNVNMIDDEKFEKNIKERKMRPELHGYNVFEELGGFDEHGMPQEKKILSKYDEEIGGIQKSAFVLGEDNSIAAREAKVMQKKILANKILESIQAPSLTIGSDFFSPEEMTTFKKSKKKVRKVRKTLRADDLLKDTSTGPLVVDREKNFGSRKKKEQAKDEVKDEMKPVRMEIDMELDDLPPAPQIDVSDIKIEDEGDLDFQLALSKARKAKQKQNASKSSIEKMAEMVRAGEGADEEAFGSVYLHATAEFCRTLGDLPSYEGEGANIYGDEKMDFESEEQQNYAAEMEERGRWNEVEIDETPVDITRESELDKAPILEEEPEVGTGMAGALRLAMKKGYLEQEKRKPSAPARMNHLQAKHYSIEDKNYDEERSAHHKRDMYAGPLTEFKDKDHYKPEVKLEYTDEDGRTISAKEAFRLLSHKFHGKGSGKNKIDKKRRKHEQDKLMQHMNSTDTPLGTLELLQERQKQSHTPYIVLSGNKAGQSSALTKISKR